MNSRKVLLVASVISFIEWFNKENVEFLLETMKCEVHIACNFDYMEDTDPERTKKYIDSLKEKGVLLHNIQFARNPLNKDNIRAYRDLKAIINKENYSLVHCHTPAASMITRLASKNARKHGTVVMYSCHGFHFHKSSPKKNWLIYYPMEKWLSKYCDYLVTINKEDYSRAKRFRCKNVRYIPGVGVDIKRIQECRIDKNAFKRNLGLPEGSLMILSIGELIERKNHRVIIQALGKLKRKDIYYVISGKGPLKNELISIARKYGIEDNVMFLGFRNDVPELCNAADISAFPSKIEGLGLAGIEAMAAGVPLVASNVHGILDYVIDGKTGFVRKPNDVDGFAQSIQTLADSKDLREAMASNCIEAVRPFDLSNALPAMWDIYKEILEK
ncbi:MAG: glycosyltransferase family 4 protein [Bacilli bacterium]|nr:glycosyltransferase family 4 protein [Bacilli bacterium]